MVSLASVLLFFAACALCYIVLVTLRSIFWQPKAVPMSYQSIHIGDITLEELSKCTGEDPFRPILFAVQGKVYDVTDGKDFYGPGGPYQLFAGREIARALGKMAITEDECNSHIDDLSKRELATLQHWVEKFDEKYKVVGQVVDPKLLTLDELAAYDGSDPAKPIFLAVRGVIFNVTQGRDFYGPDGAYPFGGRECARALAKYSVEIDDCIDDLQGCSLAEMDALRDWEARFHSKYPVVGKVAKPGQTGKE